MKKLLVAFLLISIVFVITPHTVQSSPLEESVDGTVGGVSVTALKGGNAGSSYWTSYVWSRADSAIGTIGYTYWTIRQYCISSATYPYGFTLGGDVLYGDDSYFSVYYNNYASCPYSQSYELQNLGNHDFKHGNDVWQPYVARIITINP